jgi:hypothetical protein
MHFYVSAYIALRDHKFNELFIIFKRVNVEKVSIFLAIHPLMYICRTKQTKRFLQRNVHVCVGHIQSVSEMEGIKMYKFH